MEQLFQSILLLSCVGGVLTGVLLLLKPLTRRTFGPRWQYCVWLCVLVVMLLPVRFDLPTRAAPTPQTQTAQALLQNSTLQTDSAVSSDPALPSQIQPLTAPTTLQFILGILAALPALWLLGAVLCLGGAVLSYLNFLRIIRKNSKLISCPALDGIKAGRKAQIERRFTMIQISKKPSRLVSVLSVITAIALLSTSVFASGVAASAAGIGPKEKRVIEVYQAQIKVELTNKPLIDGGVAYLPLRETLTTFGLPNEAIRWERDQSIHITASDGATFVCTIGGKNVSGTVGDISPYLRNVTNERVVLRADYAMHNAAILKSGVAYVPYEFFHQMQIISPPLLKGFSVQCHQDGISDKAPLLLPLSLNDLIVLSRKSTDGADLSAADFSGFLGEETADGRPMYRYEIDDTYYVTLDTRDGCFIPWLNNSSRGDAINIAACYYDGSPWWYTAE